MARTLIVTNDFPPRVGGIESFVAQVCRLLDDEVVVLTRHGPGAERHDRELGYPVIRHSRLLLPTPSVSRLAADVLRRHGCDRVVFGAAAPLGLLAGSLRRAGARHILALSHGHEVWWARVPVARQVLRRIGDDVDHLSTISDFTASRIGPALSPIARQQLVRLPPPVDPALFTPDAPVPGLASEDSSAGSGPAGRPRCVSVARFVAQKNLSALIEAWALLRYGADPVEADLVLVGDGPQRRRLQALVRRRGLQSVVRFTGALPPSGVRAELAAARVFALPVRTRWGGLNPEGLGLVFCEAAAAGLPVVVGRSGGAPETVLDGASGFVVGPDDVAGLAARLRLLLTDPSLAARFGAAGRRHVATRFSVDETRRRLHAALGLTSSTAT